MKTKINKLKKMKNIRIEGEGIILRSISEDDVTQKYLDWINNKEVNRFLGVGKKEQSLEDLQSYVKEKISKKDCLFLAIIEKKLNLHIGNVKIEPIDYNNRKAAIGIMIGNKNFWGRGHGTEAMHIAANLCFQNLSLDRVTLGVAADNIGGIKAYKKVGFVQEAFLREDVIKNGKKYDWILMGLLKKEFH